MRSRGFVRYTAIALAALVVASCSSNPAPKAPPPANIAPKFPDYPVPVIPEALKVTPEIRDLQDVAWRRLQAGDLRGASRDFGELLKRSPNFYPAETGLGYASLAGRDFKPAATHFLTALTQDNYRRVLEPLLARGDFLLNLSVDVSSVALIKLAHEKGALYLDTCIEPWPSGYTDMNVPPARRTNYALRETALALRSSLKNGPTAVLTHGANPVSYTHLTLPTILRV